MGQRMDAGERVITLVYQWIIGLWVAGIVTIVGMIWMVIDVLWQAILGTEGLSSSSRPAQVVAGVLQWTGGQFLYALTGGGDGGFRLLPSV